MKFVFVTRDVGNGNALRPIAELARGNRHAVFTFFGEGKPYADGTEAQVENTLRSANRLIVSLSSSEERVAMERFAMETAVKFSVPIVIVSDIYGMIHRSQWLGGLARSVAHLTVVSDSELPTAKSYVGLTTEVVALPNPSWVDYFNPPKETGVREKFGIRDDHKMVLVVGNKVLDRNHLLLEDLKAVVGENKSVHLLITSHPGANHTMDELGLFAEGAENVTFIPKKTMDSFDILCASDLVITSGGSSMIMMAAAKRIPVIDLMHELDCKYWQNLSGLDFWPPAREGISALVRDSRGLGFAINDLLYKGSLESQKMCTAQKERFKPKMFANAAEDVLFAIKAL